MILELTGAIGIHNLNDEQYNRFKDDPMTFLAEFDLDPAGNIKIMAAENSATEINLTLPFYSELDEPKASSLTDDNIKDVAGGEIFIYPTIIIAVTAAAAGGLYALSKNVKQQAKDITYEALTGEENPNKGGK